LCRFLSSRWRLEQGLFAIVVWGVREQKHETVTACAACRGVQEGSSAGCSDFQQHGSKGLVMRITGSLCSALCARPRCAEALAALTRIGVPKMLTP
jgi:hypothetical protein